MLSLPTTSPRNAPCLSRGPSGQPEPCALGVPSAQPALILAVMRCLGWEQESPSQRPWDKAAPQYSNIKPGSRAGAPRGCWKGTNSVPTSPRNAWTSAQRQVVQSHASAFNPMASPCIRPKPFLVV